jgi:hypothetical protein
VARFGGSTLPDDVQARILDMCRAGRTRNDIARELGISAASVSGSCTAPASRSTERQVKAATAARTVDMRARRAEVAELLLEDAVRLRAQMWEPHEYIDHGGKDFDEARWTQDEPSPADKLKLMQAAVAALGRHMNLEQHDAGTPPPASSRSSPTSAARSASARDAAASAVRSSRSSRCASRTAA